jgi:3-hydroxyisobutyrate dehydrogenase-like beta-hydroxyacid dehydrogenase
MTAMTTAIIGTGGLGSIIARHLGAGGETLRLSSADHKSAQLLAAQIGADTVAAAGTARRCRAPVPSSWRCGFPCSRAS